MRLQVKNQSIKVVEHEALVSGSVNVYTARFEFDSVWDGYERIAVFNWENKGESIRKEVLLSKDECAVPWEVLENDGKLTIGVYGVKDEKRYPTVYTSGDVVLVGAGPSDRTEEPTPGVTEQVLSDISKIKKAVPPGGSKGQVLAKKSDNDYDSEWRAIEEGNGQRIIVRQETDGVSIMVKNKDGTTDTAKVKNGEKGKTGDAGATGPAGADGYSPAANVQETVDGAEITIIDKNGTTKVTVKNGKTGPQGPKGEDGGTDLSLSITGATVGQIAKITEVDEEGKPTAWEAVPMDYTLIVTVNTQDGVAVTGQVVTVRAGGPDGAVYATKNYNGQPVSFRVPDGFAYFVEVSDNLASHFRPSTAKGVINAASVSVTLLYNDFHTITTGPDIQAALDAGMDLTDLVGEQVSCQKSGTVITWDVADYDTGEKAVTLLTQYALPDSIVFEPQQALMYCANGLTAGNYTYKWGNAQYYITLTRDVPAGGQLKANTEAFETYASQDTAEKIETGTVGADAVEGATSLGQDAAGDLNHRDRVLYGSNNFGESGALQWLNSAEPANTPLPRVSKFSRRYAPAVAGFMRGLDADFLACVAETLWKCSANNVYECPESLGGIAKRGEPYTVTAKFAFASEMEIFGSYSGAQSGDQILGLYVGAENVDRIKYYNSSARSCWLRSPHPNFAYIVRSVNTSGAATNTSAQNGISVVVACVIKKSA